MISKIELLDFFKKNRDLFAEKYGIDKIALFGSYSRDEANEQSDIDIAVEYLGDKAITYREYLELEDYLCERLNAKIDIVNYKYMNPIIKSVALKDFIYV